MVVALDLSNAEAAVALYPVPLHLVSASSGFIFLPDGSKGYPISLEWLR